MKDRFLDDNEAFTRLVKEYLEYKTLFVAFDFDNTVWDYHGVGDTFPLVTELLQDLKNIGCIMILFTCREGLELEKAVEYCKTNGYEPYYINQSPIYNSRKPFYNVLLDDRAGLASTYRTTRKFVDYINNLNLAST